MSEPTRRSYKFATLQEIVDRVPGDRIQDCMEELGAVMAAAKLTVELAYDATCNLAKADGKELPPAPERMIVLPPELEWVDDGKQELITTLHDMEGEPILSLSLWQDTKQDTP